MFQAKVGGKFAALCILDSNVDTLAQSLKEVLLSTAKDFGHKRGSGAVQPEMAAKITEVHKH